MIQLRNIISSVQQIKNYLEFDGDLREGEHDEPYTVNSDDRLGFYQQSCEFLIHKLDELFQLYKERGEELVAEVDAKEVVGQCLLDWDKAELPEEGRAWMRRRARVLGLPEPEFGED